MCPLDATTRTDLTPPPPDTGERLIPDIHGDTVAYAEHIVRYQFAAPLVEGRRVLDVACGAGYGSHLLREAGASSVTGVDYSPATVRYAADRYPGVHPGFVTGDAARMPLSSSSFDVVISLETIEHLHDPGAFLGEVRRVLVPGGIFVVSTPNKGVFVEGNPFHVHEFGFEELQAALKGSFRSIRTFVQNDWIVSGIFSGETTAREAGEIPADASIRKVMGIAEEESLYIVCVCSDEPLPHLNEAGAMTGIYEMKGFQQEADRLQEEIGRLRALRDVIREKDQHIANFQQMVQEKDSLIVSLRGVVAEKAEALANTNAELLRVRRYSLSRTASFIRRLLGKSKSA